MPRSTTISIRSAISSLARFTNKCEPVHWPSGALSRLECHLVAAMSCYPQSTADLALL